MLLPLLLFLHFTLKRLSLWLFVFIIGSRELLQPHGLDGCRGLDALQKKAFGGPTLKNAVLFATYATLVSAATTKKQSRLDQLVAWCGGPSFDGCVIFDEAHRSEAVF